MPLPTLIFALLAAAPGWSLPETAGQRPAP